MNLDLFEERVELPTPRDYQVEPFAKSLAFFEEESDEMETGLGIFPTAFGKSLLIGFLAQKLIRATLVIQPNAELLAQNFKKFGMYGGRGSCYSASLGIKQVSRFMFVTPGSVIKILSLLKKMGFHNIIVDEADFNSKTDDPTSMFMQIITELQPMKVFGLTASPTKLINGPILQFLTRLSPKNGKFWRNVVHVTQIQEMAAYWAKLKYAVEKFDGSSLQYNSAGTEFTEESVKITIDKNKVNVRMRQGVEHWLKTGDRKSIILYCDSIETASQFEIDFPGQCYTITSKTNKKRRKELVDGFKNGDFPILANVRIFTVGFDHPDLDCIMIGYPTNSWRLYYQTLGRIVRVGQKCPCGSGEYEKRCCKNGFVIDFCGNVERFGKIEDITIENVEGWGWGIFNKGDCLTSFDMNMRPRRTKDFLLWHHSDDMKKQRRKGGEYKWIHFGKYSGEAIDDPVVPDWYLKKIVGYKQEDHRNWLRNKGGKELKGMDLKFVKAALDVLKKRELLNQ